jgi:molybdopterin-guanine dinucleotide biosynthesis protein A
VTLSTTSAAIIAGGRARRFSGQDKSRLVVEGRTIIVRQVEILQRVASRIFVGPEREYHGALGLEAHADAIEGAGALGGIYTALAVAPPGRVVTVACDLPFLESGMLARLVELADGRDGAWVRTARGIEPLVACYQTSAAARIRARILTGALKAADLASTLDMAALDEAELRTFGAPDRLLANINTADDLARFEGAPKVRQRSTRP